MRKLVAIVVEGSNIYRIQAFSNGTYAIKFRCDYTLEATSCSRRILQVMKSSHAVSEIRVFPKKEAFDVDELG